MNFSKPRSVSRHYILVLLLVVLMSACSSATKKADTEQKLVSPNTVAKIAKPVLSDADKAQYTNALSLYADGALAEAEVVFQNLTDKHPRLAGAFVNLGLIRQGQDQIDEAKTFYDKALEINPDNISALVQVAVLNQSEGKFAESESLLKHALTIEPQNILVNYNLGVLYELYLRDYGKAIAHYQNYVNNATDEDVKTVERWIKLLERK